jgi:peptidoglycan/LPS O-acetylase OafA/YrhL
LHPSVVSQSAPSVPLDSARLALEKQSPVFDCEKPQIYGLVTSPQRIPSLDGLRGISIWAVMLAHASSHFASTPFHVSRVHDLLSVLSYFGVTTFFVISGFLITKLLLKEHAKTSRIDLTRFYRRRAYRILPAALLYIAIVLCLSQVTLSQAAYALTFTTTYFFGHAAKPLQQLWSLSVEEQFYLLWPLAFWFSVRGAKRYCWAIMFLSPILRIALKHHGYVEYSHLAPAIADSIAPGCLLAFYEDRVRGFVRKYLLSWPVFMSLCTVMICAAGLLYWKEVVLLWGVVPCLLALTISIAIERKDGFLNRGVLVWTGLLSYSLYLWQQPFLVFDGPLNYFSARILMTFAAAYASYRFIEHPLLRLSARRNKDLGLNAAPVILTP